MSGSSDSDPRVVTDRAGLIRSLNPGAAALLNVTARFARHRPFVLFFAQNRSDLEDAMVAASTGEPIERPAQLLPRGRRVAPVTLIVTSLADGFEWVVRPGTDRDVATPPISTAAAAPTDRRSATIVPDSTGPSTGAAAMVMTDRGTFIQSLNEPAALLLNVSVRHARRRQLALFFVEGRVELIQALLTVYPGGEPVERDVAVRPLERSIVPVSVRVSAVGELFQWVLQRRFDGVAKTRRGRQKGNAER